MYQCPRLFRCDLTFDFSSCACTSILSYNTMSDIRQLVHSACYPSGNDTYIRDQNTLTTLFKEPGKSKSERSSNADGTGFFVALQELALDRNLSQNERLFASLITGREMKTKWRGKVYVPRSLDELLNLREGLYLKIKRMELGKSCSPF